MNLHEMITELIALRERYEQIDDARKNLAKQINETENQIVMHFSEHWQTRAVVGDYEVRATQKPQYNILGGRLKSPHVRTEIVKKLHEMGFVDDIVYYEAADCHDSKIQNALAEAPDDYVKSLIDDKKISVWHRPDVKIKKIK